ncbi:uncharacterized protein LODBEIA_P17300 [Lodderomyces beijingensis]|uniref:Uncharacterized protein n=1 Tax=Lodderomyces beijingensis TaxID=1775926 RepID=A0ABP0ZK42_9ASCO
MSRRITTRSTIPSDSTDTNYKRDITFHDDDGNAVDLSFPPDIPVLKTPTATKTEHNSHHHRNNNNIAAEANPNGEQQQPSPDSSSLANSSPSNGSSVRHSHVQRTTPSISRTRIQDLLHPYRRPAAPVSQKHHLGTPPSSQGAASPSSSSTSSSLLRPISSSGTSLSPSLSFILNKTTPPPESAPSNISIRVDPSAPSSRNHHHHVSLQNSPPSATTTTTTTTADSENSSNSEDTSATTPRNNHGNCASTVEQRLGQIMIEHLRYMGLIPEPSLSQTAPDPAISTVEEIKVKFNPTPPKVFKCRFEIEMVQGSGDDEEVGSAAVEQDSQSSQSQKNVSLRGDETIPISKNSISEVDEDEDKNENEKEEEDDEDKVEDDNEQEDEDEGGVKEEDEEEDEDEVEDNDEDEEDDEDMTHLQTSEPGHKVILEFHYKVKQTINFHELPLNLYITNQELMSYLTQKVVFGNKDGISNVPPENREKALDFYELFSLQTKINMLLDLEKVKCFINGVEVMM